MRGSKNRQAGGDANQVFFYLEADTTLEADSVFLAISLVAQLLWVTIYVYGRHACSIKNNLVV